jgi:hypothetical protein
LCVVCVCPGPDTTPFPPPGGGRGRQGGRGRGCVGGRVANLKNKTGEKHRWMSETNTQLSQLMGAFTSPSIHHGNCHLKIYFLPDVNSP